MAWEQRRAGCDEPQRLKILMVRKTWINMSKVTAEALDLEIETSRFDLRGRSLPLSILK